MAWTYRLRNMYLLEFLDVLVMKQTLRVVHGPNTLHSGKVNKHPVHR